MSGEPSDRNSKPRRKPRPKTVYRGIEAVWSPVRGAWCWRARKEWTIAGVRVRRVGTLRLTQLLAHQDYLRLGEHTAAVPRHVQTLTQALDLVAAEDREHGLPAATTEAMVRGHGRALLRFFGPDYDLAQLDEAAVRRYVTTSLEQGRSPNTIGGHDWTCLRRCCGIIGAHDVVAMLGTLRKRLLKSALKRVPPQMAWFTVDEVKAILAAMRRRPVLTAQNHRARIRPEVADADADLVQLLVTTGVRALELGRVTLADVSRGELRIARAKDRGHPRIIPIGDDLAPIVARLEATARALAGPTTPRELVPLIHDARNAINRTCRRWQRILHEPRLSGRALRHSLVTAVIATGGTSGDAMAAAGHRSLRTTERYVHALSSRPAETRRRVASAFGLGDDAAAPAASPAPPAADRPGAGAAP